MALPKIMTEGSGAKALDEVLRQAGPNREIVSAAALTASPSWQGKCICFTQACTVTIPAGLPDDFSCGWSQDGAGQVTFVAGAGVTLQSAGGALKSAVQYATGAISAWGTNIHRLYGNMGS